MNQKIKEWNHELNEWTDIDVAMYLLAIQVGLLNQNETFIGWKGMFYTDNTYSLALTVIIDKMVEIKFLEYDEDKVQVRKNKSFILDYGIEKL